MSCWSRSRRIQSNALRMSSITRYRQPAATAQPKSAKRCQAERRGRNPYDIRWNIASSIGPMAEYAARETLRSVAVAMEMVRVPPLDFGTWMLRTGSCRYCPARIVRPRNSKIGAASRRQRSDGRRPSPPAASPPLSWTFVKLISRLSVSKTRSKSGMSSAVPRRIRLGAFDLRRSYPSGPRIRREESPRGDSQRSRDRRASDRRFTRNWTCNRNTIDSSFRVLVDWERRAPRILLVCFDCSGKTRAGAGDRSHQVGRTVSGRSALPAVGRAGIACSSVSRGRRPPPFLGRLPPGVDTTKGRLDECAGIGTDPGYRDRYSTGHRRDGMPASAVGTEPSRGASRRSETPGREAVAGRFAAFAPNAEPSATGRIRSGLPAHQPHRAPPPIRPEPVGRDDPRSPRGDRTRPTSVANGRERLRRSTRSPAGM